MESTKYRGSDHQQILPSPCTVPELKMLALSPQPPGLYAWAWQRLAVELYQNKAFGVGFPPPLPLY